ncbi:MAG: hypothetical protein WEA09_10575 [Gemmatimonadota bacterium]
MTQKGQGNSNELVLAHLSGLHVGLDASRHEMEEGGAHTPATGISSLVDRLVESQVDIVVVAGGTFWEPIPTLTAVTYWMREVQRLQAARPHVKIFLVAGWRETPLVGGHGSPLELMAGMAGVEVVWDGARSELFPDEGLEMRFVTAAALEGPVDPRLLQPVSDQPRRILVVAGQGSTAPQGPPSLVTSAWNYIALGGAPQRTRLAVGVHDPGTLVRPQWSPWDEAGVDRGFLLVRFGERLSVAFRTLPKTPLVDPAPLPWPQEGTLDRSLKRALSPVPGGVEGKSVRIRIGGGGGRPFPLDPAVLHRLSEQAADFRIELPSAHSDVSPLRSDSSTTSVQLGFGTDVLELPGGGYSVLTASSPSLLARVPRELLGVNPHLGFLHGWKIPRTAEKVITASLRLLGVEPLAREGDAGSTPRGATPAESARLMELRADAAEVQGDLEARTMEWLRERQDAETNLEAYRSRARELRDRLREVESRKEGYPCPTCHRPLGSTAGEVREHFQEEWESVVQDGTWWKRRREQLELKPPALRDLERQALRLHARLENAAQEHGGGEDLNACLGGKGRPGTSGLPIPGFDASSPVSLPEGDSPQMESLLMRTGRMLNHMTRGHLLGVTVRRGRFLVDAGGRLRPLHRGVEALLVRRALHLALILIWSQREAPPPWILLRWPLRRRVEEEASFFATLAKMGASLPPLLLVASPGVANRAREHARAIFILTESRQGETSRVDVITKSPPPPLVGLD